MSADPSPTKYMQKMIIFHKNSTCKVFIIPWSIFWNPDTINTKVNIGTVWSIYRIVSGESTKKLSKSAILELILTATRKIKTIAKMMPKKTFFFPIPTLLSSILRDKARFKQCDMLVRT